MERKQVKMKNKKNVGALIILLLAVIRTIPIACKYRLDKKESAQSVTVGNLENLDSERAKWCICQGKRKMCAVSGYNKQL